MIHIHPVHLVVKIKRAKNFLFWISIKMEMDKIGTVEIHILKQDRKIPVKIQKGEETS